MQLCKLLIDMLIDMLIDIKSAARIELSVPQLYVEKDRLSI